MSARKMALGVATATFVSGVLVVGMTAGSQDSKTVRDGVYTDAQATRGQAAFEKTCATCHTVDAASKTSLEGPPLAGPTFFNNWEDRSVFELVTSIRLSMPPDGSLIVGPDLAADLIAHILKANKLPAGQTELKGDASGRAIKILPPAASH